VRTWAAVPVLPDGSVTEATTSCGPALSVVALSAHPPPACTVEVRVWPPTVTFTARPAGSSVVPVIIGVESLVERAAPPSMPTSGAVRSSMGLVIGLLARATVLGVRTRPLREAPSPKDTTPAPRIVPTHLALAPSDTAPTTCQ
jgi:hypothetical protein